MKWNHIHKIEIKRDKVSLALLQTTEGIDKCKHVVTSVTTYYLRESIIKCECDANWWLLHKEN